MTPDVTAQDVAQYRKTAQEMGHPTAHLSDDQVARQIQILRGGLFKPSPDEIKKIRARAKKTERVFLRAKRTVQGILKKADSALGRLGSAKADGKRNRKEEIPSFWKMAQTIAGLPRQLLGTPPSLLGRELQKLLSGIDRWAARAQEALEQKGPKAERAVRAITRELRQAIQKALAAP